MRFFIGKRINAPIVGDVFAGVSFHAGRYHTSGGKVGFVFGLLLFALAFLILTEL